MNSKSLQKFKARLEAERDTLLRSLNRHERDLRDSHTGNDIAGPDRAAELEEAEIETQIVESEERLLEKVAHALDRIDKGAYDVCEGCDKPIPEARLDAKPSVSLCIECQEAKESAA